MVVAQFGLGISVELRGQVFGVPSPPATIEAALTAATATEAKKSSSKMVIGLVDDKEPEEEKEPEKEEDTVVERIVKRVEDVLAISRCQGGIPVSNKLEDKETILEIINTVTTSAQCDI